MEQFMDIGKKFISESMQGQQGQQGGQQHQQHHGQQHHDQQYQDQQYQGGQQQHHGGSHGGYSHGGGDDNDDDFSNVHEEAARHSGGSESSGFFSNVMGSLNDRKGTFEHEEIDEHDAVRKHNQAYNQDHVADDNTMGTAAALNVIKQFMGSGSSNKAPSQSNLMSMAFAEASRLYDTKASQGMVQGDSSKQSVVTKAGETIMKMWVQEKMGGGGGSGGSGFMSIASKLL